MMKKLVKQGWVYLFLLLLLTAVLALITLLNPDLIIIGIASLVLIAASAVFFGIKASIPAFIISFACLLYYYRLSDDFDLRLLILILVNYFVIALVPGIVRCFFQKQKIRQPESTNKKGNYAGVFSGQKSFCENILSNIPSLVYAKDTDLKFIMINTAYENVLEESSISILGKTDFDLFPENIAKKMAEDDREVLTSKKSKFGIEEYVPLPNGRHIWAIANKMPFFDEEGILKGLIGITFDITEQKKMSLQLETILDSLPYAAWLKDIDGRFLFVNKLLAQSINKSKKEILGKTVMDIFPEEFAKNFAEGDLKIIKSKKPDYFQEMSLDNKRPVIHETFKTPIINDSGIVIGTTGYSKDISKMQKELNELTRLNNLFSAIIDNIPIMLFIKDAKFLRFTLINKAAENLIGISKDEIIGKNDYDLFPKEEADFFVKMDRKALEENRQLLIEEETLTSGKKSAVIKTKKLPLLDKKGNPICIIGISEDITERKQMEQTIKELAYYDEITGLPNRHLFKDRFELALEHSRRNKKKMMISMIDFDNFKLINDTHGHDIGDKILKSYADRVKKIMRKTDTFARFGGDEFIFIVNGFNKKEEIEKFADKILHAFDEPFIIADLTLNLKGSMGISIFPDDASDRVTLLKYADSAMYEVKKKGGNTFGFYNAS